MRWILKETQIVIYRAFVIIIDRVRKNGNKAAKEKHNSRKEKQMKIYHSGNFWGHHKKYERALHPVVQNREFVWEDVSGFIPAVYTGADGLVMDLCVRIDRQKVEAFVEKWQEMTKNGSLTEEEQEQLAGKGRRKSLLEEEIADAYGCDKTQCWYFMRQAYDWEGTQTAYEEGADGELKEHRTRGAQIRDIRSMSVTFRADW